MILIFCILLSLSSCGTGRKKAVSASETAWVEGQTSTAFSLSVSEDYALSLLKDSLPADCPFAVDDLSFSASKGVSLSGKADLKLLCALCDLSYPDFLPGTAAFSSSAQISFVDGKISLTPAVLTVADLSIPLEKCPAFLYSPLEERLNTYLASLPIQIQDIRIENGNLYVVG